MNTQRNGQSTRRPVWLTLLAGSAVLSTVSAAQPPVPKGFSEVKPVTRPAATAASGQSLQLANGQFFSYALPQGWRVGEDGQFALTLLAPDVKRSP